MLNISIKTIPHKSHRYETVGDYFKQCGQDIIHISDMKNPDYEILVAIHELLEMYLCEKHGIKESDITAFDIQFEKEKDEGLHTDDEEPGFDKKAPYLKEHTFATKIEKLLAKELKVNWKEYDKTIINL